MVVVQGRFVAAEQDVIELAAFRRALLVLSHQVVFLFDRAVEDLGERGERGHCITGMLNFSVIEVFCRDF